MARYLIIAAVLVASAFADDGYAAPTGGYAAPSSGGYDAPSSGGYGAPTATGGGYGYEDTGVSYQGEEEKELFDLEKIVTLIPFFLAVLAAIIIAQIIAPLLTMLFDAKLGLLAPLGGSGIDLINAVLTPLNLSLCTITPLAVAGSMRSNEGRASDGNLEILSFAASKVYTYLDIAAQKYE